MSATPLPSEFPPKGQESGVRNQESAIPTVDDPVPAVSRPEDSAIPTVDDPSIPTNMRAGSRQRPESGSRQRPESGSRQRPESGARQRPESGARQRPESAPPSFPEVPGYRIEALLGRGGMGVVYKAWQIKLKRPVALKMVLSGVSASEQELRRFRLEAEAVARLQHPNIVQIHEVGEHDGRPFFSLEFVDGGSLADRIADTPQPAGAAARLLETLALAMHAAHQRGIIHRDLKPANILLAADGTPKITDFGLAKNLEEDVGQTRSGQVMGTPSYMAPEQAEGRVDAIGPLTDVYALGAILYELLTGRPPFEGPYQVVLYNVIHLEPAAPRSLNPTAPRDLETICYKCRQKEPNQRYASARDLADDLRRFQSGEPIRARPAGFFERAYKWVRRRPAVASLMAVCAAAAAVLVIALVGRSFQLSQRRSSVLDNIHDAEAALSRQEWQLALAKSEGALSTIALEPALEEHQNRAREASARAEAGLQGVSASQRDLEKEKKARKIREQFAQKRDDAFFHSTLSSGLDRGTEIKMTEAAAREALGLFATTGDEIQAGATGVTFQPCFFALKPEEQAEVKTDCYELGRMLAHFLAKLGEEKKARAERLRADAFKAPSDAAAGARKQALAIDHFLSGDELYRHDKFLAAIPELEDAARLRPSHFWTRYFLAICYLRTQKPLQAEASLSICLQLRPDFVWSYLQRGYLHVQFGEKALAARPPQAGEAEFHFKMADADFQKALELHPDEPARYGIYLNRGVLRLRQEKLDLAAADLLQAVQLKPKEYQAYVNLAIVYFNKKQPDQAALQLDKAIELQPKLPELYRTRAQVKLAGKDPEAALLDLEEALRLVPSAGDHLLRGQILQHSRKFPEAAAAYEEALALQEDLARAHLGRAESLLQQAEPETDAVKKHDFYEEADEAYGRYLKFLKNEQPPPEAYRSRGLIREKLGNYLGAVEDYTRALDLKPDDAETLAKRGWVYLLALEGAAQAQRDFDKALRLKPENGDWYNGRGYARVKLGQYRDAVADAEEAVRRGARTARSFYFSGKIYAQAVAKIDSDPNQRDRQGLETRSLYQDMALKRVRQALDALPAAEQARFWKDTVRNDPALNPVRRSPGYAKLSAEFADKEQKLPKK